MARIIFNGWEIGMRKIPFIKLLNEKGKIPLSMAKMLKDKLVDDNESIEINIEGDDLAKEILEDAVKLKVRGEII